MRDSCLTNSQFVENRRISSATKRSFTRRLSPVARQLVYLFTRLLVNSFTHFRTKQLFFLLLLLVFSFRLTAQVTIGSLSKPQEGALLDLKEKEITASDVDLSNSSKGVLFPKVNLESATSLNPLIPSASDLQKKISKGMVVYNVNKNVAGLTEGVYVWTGEEWSPFVGAGPSAAAQIDIDCSGKININGSYVKGNVLNPYTGTITLPVEVKQPGRYNIAAYSEPYNNYYFETSGEFLKTGKFNVTLNGTGTPQNSTQGGSPNSLKMFINNVEYDMAVHCPSLPKLEIAVDDVSPAYYFSCGQVDISHAQLKVNAASTGAYISVRLQVPAESAGAKYQIKTNEVEGIRFEGSGDLIAGQQTVMLASNGKTPARPGLYSFHLISNSTDPRISECTVDVPIVGRIIKILAWGNASGGAWDILSSTDINAFTPKGAGLMLKSSALFGNNASSICPVQEITVTRIAQGVNPTQDQINNSDIVLISFDAVPTSADVINNLSNFLDNKGVVIHCNENDNITLPNRIFGNILTQNGGEGVTAYIKLLSGNPLSNGSYMNLENKNIGYDGAGNRTFEFKDSTNIEVIGVRAGSISNTNGKAAIIKHKTKHYILLGDGGILSQNPEDDDYGPLLVNSAGLPEVKKVAPYYSVIQPYNAHLLANMIIWAINLRLAAVP
ncbi:MAG: hypothetical protein LBP83_05780 [Dysgonamonadaceae bacterium]|jgi:hypothetical protein|nr:hypothetical protein [Dysgonamonadaceae bacterium]